MPDRSYSRRAISLLTAGNFLSALGGGVVLERGIGLSSSVGGVPVDSILAFLVGCCLSLVFVLGLRHVIGRVFPALTLGALLCVVAIAWILELRQATVFREALVFALLCLHFCFLFVPRTFRGDLAVAYSGKISWVELGYALGYTLGLLTAQRIPQFELPEALSSAMFLYLIAFTVDVYASIAFKKDDVAHVRGASPSVTLSRLSVCGFGLVLVGMSVGVQVLSQIMAKLALTGDPLVAFDIGTTLAPMLCLFSGMSLSAATGPQKVFSLETASGKTARMAPLVVLSFLLMAVALAPLDFGAFSSLVQLGCVFVAGFLFETLALMIFDWVGFREGRGFVATSFAVMALVATAAYACFLFCGGAPMAVFGILAISSLMAGLGLVFISVGHQPK